MTKFCQNCGNELNEGQEICLKCGVKVNNNTNPKQAVESTEETANKKAQSGFILGLVGIIAWFIPLFGYPVTICGIVFSSKGLHSKEKKGMAVAGLVLSIIFLIVTLINSILGAINAVAGY